jgi:hypothetical protein
MWEASTDFVCTMDKICQMTLHHVSCTIGGFREGSLEIRFYLAFEIIGIMYLETNIEDQE